jgi:bifunctional DNA-binding transcriptional regulator/antitoxin component of YhaV-PrlF toxin-antitoxin module
METRTKRRRGYTRLSSKRQVTIPVAVVHDLHLATGAVLRVESADGAIVLRPEEDGLARRRRALDELRGSLSGVYGQDYLRRLRDEWR